ncbi:MAG TPA: NAD(P)H-binding protein [Aliidongia sp.]|nr:NAD(P)H-binding protein [Aliidongia sp.]
MAEGRTALVLGATGGIGGEIAARLLRRGWQVRALARDPAKAAGGRNGPQPAWIAGDAMDAAGVTRAAQGVDLIVHAVNPPGYRHWAQLVLPMLESSVQAAERSGARIFLPGTVYNYGPDAFPTLTEASPQHPLTRKGAIRVRMEEHLRQAADRGVRSLILRAGDFFGAHAGNSWFAQGLVKPGKPVAAISYPGRRGIGHQWAYLPDVAETAIRLIEQEDKLAPFERFHMKGHWDPDGTRMISAIHAAIGREVPVKRFPWWLVRLASPVVPLFREMDEMRYLWREGLFLDNRRLAAHLGSEPHTPFDIAVRTALAGLGCLPAAADLGLDADRNAVAGAGQ